MDRRYLPGEHLWASVDERAIEASGAMRVSMDPEGDRMFTGDTLTCYQGRLVYRQAVIIGQRLPYD